MSDAHYVPILAKCLPIAVLLPLCGSAFAAESAPAADADSILFNGNVITVDDRDSVAEALAIKDGRILSVGTNRTVMSLAGPGTRRFDLRGLTVTPGLIDAHAHFARGGVYLLYELDLSYPGITGIGDVVRKVKAKAVDLGKGRWIRGRGWDEGKLAENRYVYAADLDPVTPANPVYLSHTMGHYGVANSVAMKMAHITRDTPDPPGGTIDRSPEGEPTGVLKESAQTLVLDLIPETAPDEMRRGIERIVAGFNQECMTAVKDPAIGPEEWAGYREVLAEGKLTVRVFALWRGGRTVEAARDLIDRIGPFTQPYLRTGNNRLISGGVKLLADGSGGARTAWLHENWNRGFTEVDEGNRGYPAVPPEILREQIRLFHRAGIHIGVHAIGDRAIDWVVDSYATALAEKPAIGLRHSIIHANLPTAHALENIAAMQERYDAAFPEPSPGFMWWVGDTYAGNFGPQRSLHLIPLKTFLELGIRWASSSDFGVTPFPARYGLWASVARETLLGLYGPNPYGRSEAIDVRAALRSYTRWAARQIFLEDEIGSLETGKLADVAVWDRDPYGVTTDELKHMKCVMTFFGGDLVHRDPLGPAAPAP